MLPQQTQIQTSKVTNWDRYYTSVPITARFTRKYTQAVLTNVIERYAAQARIAHPRIAELGGANSCFLDHILGRINPLSYDIIDNNAYGLSLLNGRLRDSSTVRLHEQSVLNLSVSLQADVVFSVGLIEHFNPAGTRQAIMAHFDLLKPGGLAIITFPTPTWLYRISRGVLEALGAWKFPDERPLTFPEVLSSVSPRAEVLLTRTLWPLILTQGVVVCRKHDK